MESQLLARGWGRGPFGPRRFPVGLGRLRRGYRLGRYGVMWRRRFGFPCGCLTLALVGLMGTLVSFTVVSKVKGVG